MQKRSELIFNLLLLPIDFIAVITAFVLSYYIRVKLEGRPVADPVGIILLVKIFLLIIPVWILIFAVTGLYSQSVRRSRWAELGKIFVAVSGGTMFLILVDFASRQPIFPAKAIPIYSYGLSFVLVAIGRQIVRAVQRSLFGLGIGIYRVLLVGSGDIARRIIPDLRRTKRSGYQLVGVIDSAHAAEKRVGDGVKVFKSFADALASVGGVDEILQADSALGQEEILEMVNYASNHHIVYRFVPNQFGLYATNSVMNSLAGVPVIEIRHTPLDGWGRILKRAFDVVGAALGLIAAAPLLLLIAVVIKLTDPGPIFYKHKRLSRTGLAIGVYKFRSMLRQYCTGPGYSGKTDAQILGNDLGRPDLAKEFTKEQKLLVDPRVSRFGAILRKTSLDELPQLINVLKGELSLVGPRPIVEAELERYGLGSSTFLALKPGITGLWQISGRSDIGYDERVKLDIYYVENWSLWLDIKILVKTAFSLLKRKGAY
ncbi:MAG TPA: sugar transferase [Candidatus Saccharimonadales bacterium]|nr:sugar transferase [Candidatus Saccharimonadales bacterium]